jgi:hypothetical protein
VEEALYVATILHDIVVVVGSKDTHKEYSYEEILKHSKELDCICRCEEGIDVRTKRELMMRRDR